MVEKQGMVFIAGAAKGTGELHGAWTTGLIWKYK